MKITSIILALTICSTCYSVSAQERGTTGQDTTTSEIARGVTKALIEEVANSRKTKPELPYVSPEEAPLLEAALRARVASRKPETKDIYKLIYGTWRARSNGNDLLILAFYPNSEGPQLQLIDTNKSVSPPRWFAIEIDKSASSTKAVNQFVINIPGVPQAPKLSWKLISLSADRLEIMLNDVTNVESSLSFTRLP